MRFSGDVYTEIRDHIASHLERLALLSLPEKESVEVESSDTRVSHPTLEELVDDELTAVDLLFGDPPECMPESTEDLPPVLKSWSEILEGWTFGHNCDYDPSRDPLIDHFMIFLDAVDSPELHDNALQAASAKSHQEIVKLLLDKGADINVQGGEYGNALQAASFGGHQKIIQLLLEKGADINAQGGHYGNALQAASLQGHTEIVCLLLDKGADIDARGGEYGDALQAASFGGYQEIVRLLLDKGADINAQCGEFGNALQAASFGGHQDIVRLLLDMGADINAQGGKYGNALQATSAPLCKTCGIPTIITNARQWNQNGNSGRPFYSCGRCRTFHSWADGKGISNQNPLCLCGKPSR
ncbi:ankyrin repeat-containing domain protein [Aspergillus pseudodeflectus]|uniref:Ankyrin repeat-containing domain protein n=1 Tax=Aspergillus pseudodeflectus TaxID=176178 RepID=A0ABR4K9L6_9EURO